VLAVTFRIGEDCWVTTWRELSVESSANTEVTAGAVEYHVLDQFHTRLSSTTDPEDVHNVFPETGRGGGGVSTNDQAVRVARQDSDRAQEQFGQCP
jgi:hypothetical protein